MANFSAKDVMDLREMTQAGMMDCKKALVECDGDMEKAKDFLRKKGLNMAEKKAGRIAAEGIVGAYIGEGVSVIAEVNCETDFVAKTDAFIAFVQMVAEQVAKANPVDVDALLAQDSIKNPGSTISALLNEAVAKIGEKISIRRFARVEGVADSYIHMGGKIGVLLEIDASKEAAQNAEFKQTMHDIAMHVAAARPLYLNRSEVPASEVEHEKEIIRAQAKNEAKPKPDAIIEKMLVGRIEKYYKEVCLLDQLFVKDTDRSIAKVVSDVAAKLGEDVAIKSFTRFEMGEGLQKREDNFAEEIAAQAQLKK